MTRPIPDCLRAIKDEASNLAAEHLASLEEAAKIIEHASKMSEALRKVRPLGGSELFVRVGETFYADPVYCGNEIDSIRSKLHELNVETAILRKCRDESAGRIAALTEALENEREECAKIADRCVDPEWDFDVEDGSNGTARQIAATIRARAVLASPTKAARGEVTERTPQDFAIEFGEYMAKAAEEYMKAISETFGKARITKNVDFTQASEAYRGLTSGIYEFRKRAARAQPAPQSALQTANPSDTEGR